MFLDTPEFKERAQAFESYESEQQRKELKSEHDLAFEFSSYTPPQTPGTEVKDLSHCYSVCSATTVPDKVSSALSTCLDSNAALKPREISTSSLSKSRDVTVDTNFKPKLIVSEQVSHKVEKLPTAKGYVFLKNKETNALLSSSKRSTNVKTETIVNTSTTSLAYKSVLVEKEKASSSLPAVSTIKEKPKQGLKVPKRKRTKANPYKKFDFDELIRAKSTNAKEEGKVDLIKREMPSSERVKKEIEVKGKAGSIDMFDLAQLFDPYSTNTKSECKSGDLVGLDRGSFMNSSGNSSQSDYDSMMTLTSSSKDSEVDSSFLDTDYLDDILEGFSDKMGKLCQSDVDESDDWLNSLFT